MHRKFPMVILVLALMLITGFLFSTETAVAVPQENSLSYVDILRGGYVNLDRVREHILFFTQNCSPRVTGYPGSYRAAEYIAEKFEEFGLEDVGYQWYNLTVPVDMGGRLELYSPAMELLANFSVHPLWPNSVNPCSTPPEGLTGQIFYAGGGEYEDYVGQDVEGGIAVLDFNSRDNWKKAASLGARAVVFIEPDSTTIVESELKYLNLVPMNVPRVYVEKHDADALLAHLQEHGGELKARLTSRVEWQVKRVPNVLAYRTGTDLKDQWIMLFAHYDAWSVVPSMAEGATDACGIAALLELARFYSQVDTRRSIMFIAFSGFGEGMAGARSFVDRMVWEENFIRALPEEAEAGKGTLFHIGIDLTPETAVSSAVYTSYFYRVYRMGTIGGGAFIRELRNPFFFDRPDRECFETKITNAWNEVYGRTWRVAIYYSFDDFASYWDLYSPNPFVLDGDAFTAAEVRAGLGRRPGSHHFSYRTGYAYFARRGTPLDFYSRLEDLENLKPQLEFVFCSTYDLLNLDLQKIRAEYTPEDILTRKKLLYGGYRLGRVTGQVVQFDVKTGYYKPVPNAIVQIYASSFVRFYKHSWFETADENGIFCSQGLAETAYVSSYKLAPYVLNETTGDIIYAPDRGRYGGQAFSHTVSIHYSVGQRGTKESPYPTVVFPCGSIEIFNTQGTNPVSATQTVMGAMQFMRYAPEIRMQVNDARTHFETDYYGFITESNVAMAFVEGGIPTELILSSEGAPGPVGILHNADAESPESGRGYTVKEGETLRLTHSLLHFARDLYYLNDYRIKLATKKRVFTAAGRYHQDAEAALQAAQEELLNKNFDEYYVHTTKSWALETEAHGILATNLKSVIYTTVTFFVMLIPFAFIAERLFFAFVDGKKRMLAVVAIFAALLTVLTIFHPGFSMATNVSVVLIGLGIATLTGPILVLLFGEALSSFKEWRERLMGKHVIGIGRIAAAMSAIGLGVSYMRKRKMRTALSLVTLIIMASTIVMFTSTVGFTIVRPFRSQGDAQYAGMFIRHLHWQGLDIDYIQYLEQKLEGKALLMPRAWAYPPRPQEGYGGTLIGPENTFVYIRAYYGLTPAEGDLVGWKSYLEGDWFSEEDEDVCILAARTADSLGVTVNDTISAEGANLRVIGILRDAVKDLEDLDQCPSLIFDITTAEAEIRFMSPSDTLYVKYDWLIRKGGLPYTAVLFFQEVEDIEPAAIELATESRLDFYTAKEKGEGVPINLFSVSVGFETAGQTFTLVPLAIAMFTVLNLMLGVVTEREREISVFSSLGLSPVHVAMTFLAEAVTLAVVSAILGYTIGIVGLNVIYGLGVLPETFYPNFASMFVFTTLAFMMLAVIAPSIYPLRKAAKLVTPSLERKWKIETKPVGDVWTIPTPFFLGREEDVDGIFEFFREYFMTYTESVPGFPFATERCLKEEKHVKGLPAKSLSAKMYVAPFTLGVSQETEILVVDKEGKWYIEFRMDRETGRRDEWIHVNEKLADDLRKQLLNWRGLKPTERKEYIERAHGQAGGT